MRRRAFVGSLGLEIQGSVDGRRGWGGGAGTVGRAVARFGFLADEAGEVRQERELLAHQGTVDPVLTGDLGEQAAQFGGPLHRGGRGGPGGGPAEAPAGGGGGGAGRGP